MPPHPHDDASTTAAEAERRAGPRVVASTGPAGGPTLAYRGATFEANAAGALHVFRLPGHPFDGTCFGALGGPVRLVDWWLDRGRSLPPPYRAPAAPVAAAAPSPGRRG